MYEEGLIFFFGAKIEIECDQGTGHLETLPCLSNALLKGYLYLSRDILITQMSRHTGPLFEGAIISSK